MRRASFVAGILLSLAATATGPAANAGEPTAAHRRAGKAKRATHVHRHTSLPPAHPPASSARRSGVATEIRRVFGPAGERAVAIFACESGLSAGAANGQYRGIAQMGSAERIRYGDGDAAAQIAAAYALYQARGWHPWVACAR